MYLSNLNSKIKPINYSWKENIPSLQKNDTKSIKNYIMTTIHSINNDFHKTFKSARHYSKHFTNFNFFSPYSNPMMKFEMQRSHK